MVLALTTCAGNWLRTITSDRTVRNNSSVSSSSELVGMTSLDGKLLRIIENYLEIIKKYLKVYNNQRATNKHFARPMLNDGRCRLVGTFHGIYVSGSNDKHTGK